MADPWDLDYDAPAAPKNPWEQGWATPRDPLAGTMGEGYGLNPPNVFGRIGEALRTDQPLQQMIDTPYGASEEDLNKVFGEHPGVLGRVGKAVTGSALSVGEQAISPITRGFSQAILAGSDVLGAMANNPGVGQVAKEIGEFATTDAGLPGLMPHPGPLPPEVPRFNREMDWSGLPPDVPAGPPRQLPPPGGPRAPEEPPAGPRTGPAAPAATPDPWEQAWQDMQGYQPALPAAEPPPPPPPPAGAAGAAAQAAQSVIQMPPAQDQQQAPAPTPAAAAPPPAAEAPQPPAQIPAGSPVRLTSKPGAGDFDVTGTLKGYGQHPSDGTPVAHVYIPEYGRVMSARLDTIDVTAAGPPPERYQPSAEQQASLAAAEERIRLEKLGELPPVEPRQVDWFQRYFSPDDDIAKQAAKGIPVMDPALKTRIQAAADQAQQFLATKGYEDAFQVTRNAPVVLEQVKGAVSGMFGAVHRYAMDLMRQAKRHKSFDPARMEGSRQLVEQSIAELAQRVADAGGTMPDQGPTPAAVARVRQQITVDQMATPAKAAPRPAPAPVRAPAPPQSLAQFLASKGGINPATDLTGDLAEIDGLDTWHRGRPFQKRLVNPKGMSMDDARRAAAHAGYIPEDGDQPELIAALRREVHDRQPVYTEEGNLTVEEIAERDRMLEEIDRMGGGDASKWTDDQISAFFQKHADDAAAALGHLDGQGERQAGDLIGNIEDETLRNDLETDLDLGWTDFGLTEPTPDLFDEPARQERGVEAAPARAENAPGPPAGGQAPAVRTVGITETSPNVWRVSYDGRPLGDSRGYRKDQAWSQARHIVQQEAGYAERDGRPPELQLGPHPDAIATTETVKNVVGATEQYVMPGAEKITDRELAERKMAAPKRAGRAQKEVGDLPLFSDERKQGSLFQPPPPKGWTSVSGQIYPPAPPAIQDKTADFNAFRKSANVSAPTAAKAYVLARGRADGNEHMVVLLPDGTTVEATTSGRQRSVAFGAMTQIVLGIRDMGAIGHHNHPSGMSLSGDDVAAMAHPGLDEVWAHVDPQLHGKRESYGARLVDGLRSWMGPTAHGEMQRLHLDASRAIVRVIDPVFATKVLVVADANLLHSHLTSRALRDAGVMQYWYDPRLDDMMAAHPVYAAALAEATRDVHMALNQLEVTHGPRPAPNPGAAGRLGPDRDLAGVPLSAGAPGAGGPVAAPAAAGSGRADRPAAPARKRAAARVDVDPRQLKLLEPEPGFTRLYRVEPDIGEPGKTDLSRLPDWLQQRVAAHGATGRWFAADPSHLPFYQQDNPDHRIVYVDVPTGDLDQHRVANNPAAAKHSLDPENEFFLPRDVAARAQRTPHFGPALAESEEPFAEGDDERLPARAAPPGDGGAVPPGAGPTPPPAPTGPLGPAVRALHRLRNSDVIDNLMMKVAPMGAPSASDQARALAKDWANADRLARLAYLQYDEAIKRALPNAADRQFLDAMDEQGVAVQRGELALGEVRPGVGWGRLSPAQLAVARQLDTHGAALGRLAVDLGVFPAALPHWTPRMFMRMASGATPGEAGAARASALDAMGVNMRASSPHFKKRKYETRAETEAAGRLKLGDEAVLANDVRAMGYAMYGVLRALATRKLVNAIREIGRQAGHDLVTTRDQPGYFTIPQNPAFYQWQPKLKKQPDGSWSRAIDDQTGETAFERVPLYIRKEFEGPLRAIMQAMPGKVYQGIMQAKSSATSLIMLGPLIHNGVVWGKALEAMPGRSVFFQTYSHGAGVRRDQSRMRELVSRGLVPITGHGAIQDITDAIGGAPIIPGRGVLAKSLRRAIGTARPEAGDAVARWIDRAGDFWHNKLLWDLVGNMQAGMADLMSDHLMQRYPGMDRKTADTAAAHFANRIAGALPTESMANASRAITNILLFSRTFNMTNLGVFKDALLPRFSPDGRFRGFGGLPPETGAKLERDMGLMQRQMADKATRRLARLSLIRGIAFTIVGYSILNDIVKYLTGDEGVPELARDYLTRFADMLSKVGSHPLELMNPFGLLESLSSTAWNEPGKENRVDLGAIGGGDSPQHVYWRIPPGKMGEDFMMVAKALTGNWTAAIDLLKRKEGTIAKPLSEILSGYDDFGRPIYNHADKSMAGIFDASKNIVLTLLAAQLPMTSIKGVYDLVTGQPKAGLHALQAAAPLVGFTLSQGHPGGPLAGAIANMRADQDYRFHQALPDLRKQIVSGDTTGAMKRMLAFGLAPRMAMAIIRSTLHPGVSASQMRAVNRFATPEQRQELERQQQP